MIKITASCDALNCFNEREFFEDENHEEILINAGWLFDYKNESIYCASCKKEIIDSGELENDED